MKRQKRTPSGLRAPEVGKDVNLGHFEARLRDHPKSTIVVDKPTESIQQQQTVSPVVLYDPNKFWSDLLTPMNIDWVYLETSVTPAVADTENTALILDVPKGQYFVIMEYTPIALINDRASYGPSTGIVNYVEPGPYKYFNTIYASLRFNGHATPRISNQYRSTSEYGDVVTSAANGTSVLNKRAFVVNQDSPLILFANSLDRIDVIFTYLNQSTGAKIAIGAITDPPTILGARVLGFFAASSVIDALLGKRV